MRTMHGKMRSRTGTMLSLITLAIGATALGFMKKRKTRNMGNMFRQMERLRIFGQQNS